MALTAQSILRAEILSILAALPSGQGMRKAVLEELNIRREELWTAEDKQSPSRRPSESNWANRASYERADMVRDGLLEPNAGRGMWRLTPTGRLAASSNGLLTRHSHDWWDLEPGEELSREDRASQYGGSVLGRIVPSDSTPNMYLYSDPTAGHPPEYKFDGWDSRTDLFLYVGEGTSGDQRLQAGNKAVANHVQLGLTLRLFVSNGVVSKSASKHQTYLGKFEIDEELPWVKAESPDQEGLLRSVLVFRLRPVGPFLRRQQDLSDTGDVRSDDQYARVAVVPSDHANATELEALEATEFVAGRAASIVGVRREALLVDRFKNYLFAMGHEADRFRIRPAGAMQYLFSDIYDSTDQILYEAKASATRNSVRQAIGQLFDYSRFVPPATRLSVLLPAQPFDDLVRLLRSLGFGLVIEGAEGEFCTILQASAGPELES